MMNKNNQLTLISENKLKEIIQDNEGKATVIQNLIVSPAPSIMRVLNLKDSNEFIELIENKKDEIDLIVWNEEGIKIIMNNNLLNVAFIPDIHVACKLFFQREKKRTGWQDETPDTLIWEGEYEPVQFTKSNLIKFLNKFCEYFDEDIEKSIKHLKIKEKKTEESEMISLHDDDNVRTVIEQTKETNIPRTFKASIPIFEGFNVELDFEAKVVKKKDSYGNKTARNIIEVRCINAKERLNKVMKEILEKMPKNIQKVYGKTEIKKFDRV